MQRSKRQNGFVMRRLQMCVCVRVCDQDNPCNPLVTVEAPAPPSAAVTCLFLGFL